ncbi:MAG: T9SS type A sorting domain-containing protein [Bacteroidetes bacterium]|nr:T9SS type A sorting domain-containing protein [Bacteroidota bacterium]
MNLKISVPGFLFLLFIFYFTPVASAQLQTGGVPQSFSFALPPEDGNIVTINAPALESVLIEDQLNPVPYRFAINMPVDIGVSSIQQSRTIENATEIWRLTINAPGAFGLTLYFDRFEMPAGAKLFVYNPQRTQALGAFTSLNNNKHSTFATGLINGDKLTLEYNAPVGASLPLLHISEIAWAYRGYGQPDGVNTGFGSSGPCEVNINCSEGSAWKLQKRSVTRIQVKRGLATLFCTGSVVNNTLNDGKPYILTADHCGKKSSELDISQWIFYFNYEGLNCPNPVAEPYLSSMTGATKIANGGNEGADGSDFFLVLLESAIPDSFNVYYNGWSRETSPSTSGVSIHHPQGDIKKVSTYKTPLQPAYWSGDSKLAHWRVVWAETANGHGTTEPGSSGSPLFDAQGRIVGTLTGGDSQCDSSKLGLPDYYGMFAYHWDKNGADSVEQLKPWLDPVNANVMSVNGWALSVNNHAKDTRVEVYPNPVTDILNIRTLPVSAGEVKITISDLFGNLMKQVNFRNNPPDLDFSIDINNLSAGLYFVVIRDGEKSMVRKFIKN